MGAPEPVVPTPATHFTQLRGRRLIVGVPGVGFRGDLRADNPVVQGGRTFIPVLTEQDYYRAEIEQLEVFAPLVPIDRVWVEDVRPDPRTAGSVLDGPKTRHPALIEDSGQVLGQRVVQAVADGFIRDLRAVSDAYPNSAGQLCVRVCSESDWYGWALTGKTPLSYEAETGELWVE